MDGAERDITIVSVGVGRAAAHAAAAVQAHSLPAFAVGYSLLGGLGFFCGYPQLPPFMTRWFPDRRGLAVSIYMCSFGSGMLFAVPVLQRLLAHFREAPTRLGSIDEVALRLGDGGQRLAMVDGRPPFGAPAAPREPCAARG